jgi:hypothetical protein
MSLLLIDDQGEFWPGDSRTLRMAFDSPYSGGEFVEYAVKNLGFVALNLYGRSVQARLRPTFVTEKAVAGLMEWLGRARVDRVVLSMFDRDWNNALVRIVEARSHIERLMENVQNERPQDLLCSPTSLDVLDSRRQLKDLVQAWPHINNSYDSEALVKLLRSVLGQRYVVVRKPASQDRIVFQELGTEMFQAYETWRTCAIGAPIEEQPDRSFGRWISGAYHEVSRDGAARLDAVDAIIRWPHAGRTRLRYQRVIFPIKPASNDTLLVAGSFTDTSVDLRAPHT